MNTQWHKTKLSFPHFLTAALLRAFLLMPAETSRQCRFHPPFHPFLSVLKGFSSENECTGCSIWFGWFMYEPIRKSTFFSSKGSPCLMIQVANPSPHGLIRIGLNLKKKNHWIITYWETLQH